MKHVGLVSLSSYFGSLNKYQLVGKSLMFVFIFVQKYQSLIGRVILGWEIWILQVPAILSPEFTLVVFPNQVGFSLPAVVYKPSTIIGGEGKRFLVKGCPILGSLDSLAPGHSLLQNTKEASHPQDQNEVSRHLIPFLSVLMGPKAHLHSPCYSSTRPGIHPDLSPIFQSK